MIGGAGGCDEGGGGVSEGGVGVAALVTVLRTLTRCVLGSESMFTYHDI